MLKINSKLISGACEKARTSARKRATHNFHSSPGDPIQRFINAIEPDTYIRPHKHENPDKREIFIILRGQALALEFDDSGKVKDFIILGAGTANSGVEFAPRVWHTIIALEEGTAVYELKDGPYLPIDDKNFAPWAPKEGALEAIEFNRKLLKELKR
ncbi:MAG: WbuC family cupin fold metalloprotein [Candidatus Omnitrophota bacterium]|jgi:cupin fold WbuC family metalloprotein